MRLFLLLAVVTVAIAEDTYVIITPTDIRPGVALSINVNILKASSDVTVQAQLTRSTDKVPIGTAHGTFQQGTPKLLEVQVPDNLHSGSYEIEVTGSGGLVFTNKTGLSYQSKGISIFIQTDKAMYKPGQTVHFRAFAMYPNLTVIDSPMDIEIYDPNTNKIKQWLQVRDASGVLTNFMIMDTQPVLGDWKIKIITHGRSEEKVFTVAHYVLPKFEVSIEVPAFGLASDTTLQGTVKATYTYGKPVKGTVKLRAKLDYWYRPWQYNGSEPMVELSLNLDGESKFTLPLSNFMVNTRNYITSGRSLKIEANVTESLTHITLSGKDSVKFYSHAEKIEFLQSNPNTFKPGLPYTAYMRVARQDDTPVMGAKSSVVVHTTVTYQLPEPTTTPKYYYPQSRTYTIKDRTFTVPDSGVVPIQVDIPDNATSISLRATYGTLSSYKTLSKSYSPSESYIQLFLRSSHLKAGSGANFEIQSTQAVTSLVYQVLSRGVIVGAGTVNGGNKKTVPFSISVNSKMAPNARIVVYYVRTDGEIVTDSISFDVEGVFNNQVSISFDKTKAQPGDAVNVQVTADPMSVVNLLAVDQSVLLLKSGNDITQSQVVEELKSYDTKHKSISPFFFGGGGIGIAARKRRMIWWPYPTYYGGSDASQIFSNAGVKVLTDATVYHHKQLMNSCPFCDGMGFSGMFGTATGTGTSGAIIRPPSNNGQSELQTVKQTRSVFPETWLWCNKTVRSDGHVTISTTVPDTITSWVASAFAVNKVSGLGIASTSAKIEAFKPFFVSLNLPYSVVRGEQVVLQANVFNYLTSDTDVLVTLEKNDDFRSIIVASDGTTSYVSQTQTDNIHVKAGEAKSVYFPIVPAELGQISLTVKAQSVMAADAVKRQLLVEPEGVPKEYNTPILLNLNKGAAVHKTVPVSLPQSVVAGSQHVRVSVIGDLMGPTVNNLDKLLRMPTGCGEQTMLGLAPDVFVANYLTSTHQLSSDIEEKAINYMEKGYQRELTFQHKDGSFSAFGDRDKSGSMWLSAFVIKTFHQAKKHIFIDDKTLVRTIEWMLTKQKSDGSFPEPGRVIHKDMQGGSASGPGLTAFVLIALEENNDLKGNIQEKLQNAAMKARSYLEQQISTITDDYALAIASYALALSRSSDAATVFTKLNSDAIVKDGMKHWHKAQTTTSSHHHYWSPPHKQSNPIDIEMSSYALLVYAHNKAFADGLSVMKWLTTQRNSNGGFASTQDTVLALQSLSEFAAMVYSNNFDLQVSVTAGNFTKQFQVNPTNALILQVAELSSIPTEVTIDATGHGMALVEVSVFFNVEQEISEPTFEVTVTLETDTLNSMKVKTCTRWLLTGASGMAVQEIGIPTGFDADVESIGQVAGLKKIEQENRKVIIYFDEITTTPLCVTMESIRTGLVAKTQPSAVRVYDYYQPDNQVTKFYQSHVLKNSSVCDVCPDCGGCP
ncbi:CD109 antigen-like isoform X2 [Mytilus edulis]|uniref:CD109 antigen-like isoform X2 n=1 Tax=Mytilus edulis TaxID=6550 RepID=UPI0039EF6722